MMPRMMTMQALFVLRVVLLPVLLVLVTTTGNSAVASAKTLIVEEWDMPYRGPKLVNAVVGDTIEFRSTQQQQQQQQQQQPDGWVAIHQALTCDDTNATLVGRARTYPASYTFTDDDAQQNVLGTLMFFASDIGNQCEKGLNMKVSVKKANLLSGLATDTCSKYMPTSTGLGATPCNLPPEQVCCYGVQIAQATVCKCGMARNGGWRTYECDYTGTPDECPNTQNLNSVVVPPLPPLPQPTPVPQPQPQPQPPAAAFEEAAVEETDTTTTTNTNSCWGTTCDPLDVQSCTCQSGLACQIRTNWVGLGGYICLSSSSSSSAAAAALEEAAVEEIDTTTNTNTNSCLGTTCDPMNVQSCNCQSGLACQIRTDVLAGLGGYSCSSSSSSSSSNRDRLSGTGTIGGAGAGSRQQRGEGGSRGRIGRVGGIISF